MSYSEKCKQDSRAAKCENGGVPHPRDCTKCLCPGDGGKLCNERVRAIFTYFYRFITFMDNIINNKHLLKPCHPSLQPSRCGEVLQATKEYTDLSKTIGNPNMNEKEDFDICYYWIEVCDLKVVLKSTIPLNRPHFFSKLQAFSHHRTPKLK